MEPVSYTHLDVYKRQVLQAGDLLVLAGHEFEDRENLTLYEISIDKTHKWKDKSLRELSLPKGTLIVMIQNEKGTVIPDGNTVIPVSYTHLTTGETMPSASRRSKPQPIFSRKSTRASSIQRM